MLKKMWITALLPLGLAACCSNAPVKPTATVAPQTVAVPKTDNQSATNAVNDWAAAWQARDTGKYLAAYAPNFKPEKGSHATWEKQRKERVGKAKSIELKLADLQVKSASANKATATFTQNYKSNTYSDKSKKQLDLELIKGKWLITRERSL
ncbi:MAG: L,D-transpeptidase Cds6 family protein [Stenotrophobium sp.]